MAEPPSVRLTGSAWGHTRGYVPLVATAQRFAELHPDVQVTWTQRSLQAFADFPLSELARTHDLVVMDHPWIAHAARAGALLPLDDWLDEPTWADLRANAVGASLRSYRFDERCWALPIDAASPVASYRPDLLAAHGLDAPRTWDQMMRLARRGPVVMPAIPLDMLGHFNMFCGALGELPFDEASEVVSEAVGVAALGALRELAGLMPGEVFEMNPIRIYEAMTTRDDWLYCFSAYGYSNYARPGYADHPLRFTTMVRYANGEPFIGTLGGAGLAVSAHCEHPRQAVGYARFVADPLCQRTLYTQSGGQPGHRAAWEDQHANALCGGFFHDTLADLDRAMLRPQYDGYMHYQDHAGDIVWRCVTQGGDPRAALAALNDLYRASRSSAG